MTEHSDSPFLERDAPTVRSTYEFRVSHADQEHLASVTLDVATDEHDVIVYSRAALESARLHARQDLEWYLDRVSAAKSGVRAAALHLKRAGVISGCRITVLSVVGTRPETDVNAVFCAATFAAWQGLADGRALPELDVIDGRHVPYLGDVRIAESI